MEHLKLCSYETCNNNAQAKGLCTGHRYQEAKGRALTPLRGAHLTKGLSEDARFDFYVDRTGDCHVWTGSLNHGYGQLWVFREGKKVRRRAHRLAYEKHSGASVPKGLDIDHTCHNPACVNPEHLRAITHEQNAENRKGATGISKSGVRGVSWHKGAKKWQVHVTHKGVGHYLGMYASVEEADQVAVAKRLELFRHSDGR